MDDRAWVAKPSCTIGLHRFGRPELQLRSPPTHGDDPGRADWHLPMNDLGSILSRLGMSVLRREIAVGSEPDNAATAAPRP